MPKYAASISAVIEVEADSLEEADEKIMSIIHSKPLSDYSAEMSDCDSTHLEGEEAPTRLIRLTPITQGRRSTSTPNFSEERERRRRLILPSNSTKRGAA